MPKPLTARLRVVALAIAACGALALPLLARADQLVTVVQKDRAFAVRELHTAVGAKVRFTNDDDFPHQISVTGPSLEVENPLQEPGEVIIVGLPTRGVFKVRCGIHPKMRLTVTAH